MREEQAPGVGVGAYKTEGEAPATMGFQEENLAVSASLYLIQSLWKES